MNDSLNLELTFKDIIDASSSKLMSGGYLSSIDIIIVLTATLICSALIAWMYRYTFQGVIYQKSFTISIILIALVTSSVIMVISGNLMLALGMVGALSIVRFRAAIKEPLDIVFIFWAITVGIANGVAFFKLSFITTIFLSALLYFLIMVPFKISSYMLIINYKNEKNIDEIILGILKKYSNRYRIRSKSIKNEDVELLCEIKIKAEESLILEELNKIKNVNSSSLVAHSNNMLDG